MIFRCFSEDGRWIYEGDFRMRFGWVTGITTGWIRDEVLEIVWRRIGTGSVRIKPGWVKGAD